MITSMHYKTNVNGVVSTYHSIMLKQYVERINDLSHSLLSAEPIDLVGNNEEFSLEDCTFPNAK